MGYICLMCMTWLTETEGRTPLERVLNKRPELSEYAGAAVGDVWSAGIVDPVILELCRLAVAEIHRCRSELSIRYGEAVEAGLTEEKISALASYERSGLFSERERVCLRFAEQYAVDAHGVGDEAFEDLRGHLTDAEVVTLVFRWWCSTGWPVFARSSPSNRCPTGRCS
jgi:alkylhydroperoxidase family enzyme